MYKYISKRVDEKTKQEIYLLQDTDTGTSREETKQKVKDALKNNVKILGLKLRSDGGLIEDLNVQKDNKNNQNMQVKTRDNSLVIAQKLAKIQNLEDMQLKYNQTILKLLTEQKNQIDSLQNAIDTANKQSYNRENFIANQLNELDSTIKQLEQQDISGTLLQNMQELRNLVGQYGSQLQQMQTQLVPVLNSGIARLSQAEYEGIYSLYRFPQNNGFISRKEDWILANKQRYDEASIGSESFDYEFMKHLVAYYSEYLQIAQQYRDVLGEMTEMTKLDIPKSSQMIGKVKNSFKVASKKLSAVTGVVAGCALAAKVAFTAVDAELCALDKLLDKQTKLLNLEKKQRIILEQVELLYSDIDKALEQLGTRGDKNVLEYILMFELPEKELHKREVNTQFYELITFLNKTTLLRNDKSKDRVAIAYILAYKLLELSATSSNPAVKLQPHWSFSQSEELQKDNAAKYIGDEAYKKYREVYMLVLLKLMENILWIAGFTHTFAKESIIDPLKEHFNFEFVNSVVLKAEDIQNRSFNVVDYVDLGY